MNALATRTDRMTAPTSTVYEAVSGGTVVHTPDRRDFHYGNLLVLDRPPNPADLEGWLAVWRAHFGEAPDVERVILQWEGPDPVPPALREAASGQGLDVETSEVLVLAEVDDGPRHPLARPLDDSDEWDEVALLISDGNAATAPFFRWRMEDHRRRIDAGQGEWWAIVDDGSPIAAAGIFWGGGIARFQEVVTHPAHRRQGLAAGLLRRMLDAHGHHGTVVIVAEEGDTGARLYRRLGFRVVGLQQTLIGDPESLRG